MRHSVENLSQYDNYKRYYNTLLNNVNILLIKKGSLLSYKKGLISFPNSPFIFYIIRIYSSSADALLPDTGAW